MVAGDAKRVVVIRNISSNLIEEAILILRSDAVMDSGGNESNNGGSKRKIDNDFLVKEAETIINSYMRENRLQKKKDRRGGSSFGRQGLHRKPLFSLLINALLLGSVALLIYLVCRLV